MIQAREIKLVPLSEIKLNPKNRNHHPPEQIDRLVEIIKYQGFRRPGTVSNRSGFLACGEGRYLAAKRLGLDVMPIMFQDYDSEEQEYADGIADNTIDKWAELDLSSIYEDVSAFENLNTDMLGFKEFEMPTVLEPGAGDDEIPEQVEAKTKLGDLYRLGDHRLLCGDSTDVSMVSTLVGQERMDLVFTDPPYGISVVQSNSVGGGGPTKFDTGTDGAGKIVPASTYRKIQGDDTTEAAKDCYQLCVSLGIEKIILWGGNYFTDFLPPSRCWIVWDKEMTGNFSQAEMAWTSFTVGGVKIFKHLWNGLSRKGNRADELTKRVHPTQKPVGLFQEIFDRIECGQNILDLFGGSGSTLIACEKTKRKCFMMELDPHYVDVIVARWEKYTGKKAVLA